MRVLFVTEKGGYHGGVEQNIADTVRGLRARGHRCALAFGEASRNDDASFHQLFDAVWPCPGLSADAPPQPREFSALMDRAQPDVVYAHKIRHVQTIDAAFGRIRTVRMIHDHDLTCPRRHKYFAWNGHICRHAAGWRCWLDGAFVARDHTKPLGLSWVNLPANTHERRRQRQFDRLLVGSAFMREQLVVNGFEPAQVTVLPPVVRMRAEATPFPDQPTFLYVGQLIRGKGLDLLLHALRDVPGQWRCIVAGTGNGEAGLRALAASLGLSGQVEFRGWTPREQLGSLYARATCVVVPSRWPEPFGMIGLEAMHHGRPVVAFDVGGIPEWLEAGTTGLLIPERDTRALADALTRLLGDKALVRTLGANAQQAAREKWDFDQYVGKLEWLLQGRHPAAEAA